MKLIRIFRSIGSSVVTDLDEVEKKDRKEKNIGQVAYVFFGKTTKAEMMEHIKNRDFLVCQYHIEGYAYGYVAPMCNTGNLAFPGSEIIYFRSCEPNGNNVILKYTGETDTWSVES